MELTIAKNFMDFSKHLLKKTGENINLCYQCKKCSSGCPVSIFMDYTPNQLIYAARLGLEDIVLQSKTIWLCASCETCTTRCPQGIDIVKVMDELRSMADELNILPAIPEIALFYHAGLSNIRIFGRLYELGLIGVLKLQTKEFMKDFDSGLNMIKKGKLKFLPSFKGSKSTGKIFSNIKTGK